MWVDEGRGLKGICAEFLEKSWTVGLVVGWWVGECVHCVVEKEGAGTSSTSRSTAEVALSVKPVWRHTCSRWSVESSAKGREKSQIKSAVL